jgi:sulfatase maturation enzyme AslB (radical SAM superfamily)
MDLTPFRNCLALKNSLYISNEDQSYKPCCWFKGGINAKTFNEYQVELNKLDLDKGCEHCIKQAEAGATWTHSNLFKDPTELVIGVCFDNICNIKCITCSPYHSSQHIAEWDKLGKFKKFNLDKKKFTKLMADGPEKLKLVEDTILSKQFDTLRLEIFGGEPLINPVVIDFIKWLTTKEYATKTNLVITTNGTTSLSVIEDYLQHFNRVTVQFSVDGIGEVFDTMRFGANFREAESNIKHFQQLAKHNTNFSFGFNYTLSWLNADKFVDFYNWVKDNFDDLQSLHLTKITGPRGLVVDLLPASISQSLLDEADKLSIPLNKEGFEREEFKQLVKLYKQSMITVTDLDATGFLKNKNIVEIAIDEIKELFELRGCSVNDLPMIDKLHSFFETVLPPYRKGEVFEKYCVGTDYCGKQADGLGGFTEILLEKDSYHCGYRAPLLEKGFLVDVFCKGQDEWGKFADGNGGYYEDLIQENSYGCGFREPPLEKGFLVEVFCKGPDEWGKFADGNYGFYEELRIKDSLYCELKNNSTDNK